MLFSFCTYILNSFSFSIRLGDNLGLHLGDNDNSYESKFINKGTSKVVGWGGRDHCFAEEIKGLI